MEISLAGLATPTQFILALLILILAFVGKRIMSGMDRVAASVEKLNTTMASVVATQTGHEKRIDLLEAR